VLGCQLPSIHLYYKWVGFYILFILWLPGAKMYTDILQEYATRNDMRVPLIYSIHEEEGLERARRLKLTVTVQEQRYVSAPLDSKVTAKNAKEAAALVAVEDLLRRGLLQLKVSFTLNAIA
jgi:dsRNA-specific ribonuclease